jgi:type III restriction enzyme
MNRQVNAISGRLSLRAPQRDSLAILDRITEIAPPGKNNDLAEVLQIIQSEFPSVADFEREFPSLCFSLATGVGKTRLMGAFIAYLHLAHGVENFFVLAPNLTIYNKLITDFTPNTPKYVFKGIAEFATESPEIITGDTYEKRSLLSGAYRVHINIFNISKINSEVRGGASPRIKRLSEYIGQSYFEYLAALPDLVLLMDESHRYRASAGVKAINELKPILGLELTATPYVETARGATPFKNVIFDYPLSRALEDGFVKEPAVVTQLNFTPSQLSPEQIERLKLEDGVRLHETLKVELATYALQNGVKTVKPFILVIARDTTHAKHLLETIQADTFFEGRYKQRAIQVDSSQSGAEKDEVIERLLKVESPEEPTEIVIHVNMLKEGWDVTNLYTIIPLRAANARILIEQSIGRGLRLPYGKRTGVTALDRLNIIAHDRFQEIIDEANRPDSPIRLAQVIIGRDVTLESKKTVVSEPNIVRQVTDSPLEETPAPGSTAPKPSSFSTPEERKIAQLTLAAIQQHENLPQSSALQSPEVQALILEDVRAAYTTGQVQAVLPGIVQEPDMAKVIERTTRLFIQQTIDIPRVVVLPKGEVTTGYHDFDLVVWTIRLQPVDRDLLIQHLRTHERETVKNKGGLAPEKRPEDYLIRVLVDFDDISYDDHADLLYKLTGQLVTHLRSYLSEDDAINVLQYHQRQLAELIHAQMQEHHWEKASAYEATVSKGFMTLKAAAFTVNANDEVLDYRGTVADPRYIREAIFGGFGRCLYEFQKFDSDTERRLAVVLEQDGEVVKWFKPSRGQFQIFYSKDHSYEPDFVVETTSAKFLCEPKRADQMGSEEVLAKAKAAKTWCEHASGHELKHGGKPWKYLLIPHDAITGNMTLSGLASRFAAS